MRLSRRRFLIASGASATLALWPRTAAWGAPGGADPRLLVVLLRGGLDGLHALPPLDDPDAARLRAALLPDAPLALDGSFGLHPALGFAHTLYQRGDLLPVVAVAPPYRERSHFDAQDCLENGTGTPGGSHTGWLNRCVGAMGGAEGLAIASVMPLSLRGPAPARTWSPPLPQAVDPRLLDHALVHCRGTSVESGELAQVSLAPQIGRKATEFMNQIWRLRENRCGSVRRQGDE